MYHVPILELLLGYLALYLDKLLNPDNVLKQEEIIKEFESATLNTYEVDLYKIHSIIDIQAFSLIQQIFLSQVVQYLVSYLDI